MEVYSYLSFLMRTLGLYGFAQFFNISGLLMSILDVSLVQASFQWLLFQPSIRAFYFAIYFLII